MTVQIITMALIVAVIVSILGFILKGETPKVNDEIDRILDDDD